jgi:hypothetical protein
MRPFAPLTGVSRPQLRWKLLVGVLHHSHSHRRTGNKIKVPARRHSLMLGSIRPASAQAISRSCLITGAILIGELSATRSRGTLDRSQAVRCHVAQIRSEQQLRLLGSASSTRQSTYCNASVILINMTLSASVIVCKGPVEVRVTSVAPATSAENSRG